MYELIIPKDINEDPITAEIMDAEGDILMIEFHYDMCAFIDTSIYSHIYLEHSTLIKLVELIEEADAYYTEAFNEEENYCMFNQELK